MDFLNKIQIDKEDIPETMNNTNTNNDKKQDIENIMLNIVDFITTEEVDNVIYWLKYFVDKLEDFQDFFTFDQSKWQLYKDLIQDIRWFVDYLNNMYELKRKEIFGSLYGTDIQGGEEEEEPPEGKFGENVFYQLTNRIENLILECNNEIDDGDKLLQEYRESLRNGFGINGFLEEELLKEQDEEDQEDDMDDESGEDDFVSQDDVVDSDKNGTPDLDEIDDQDEDFMDDEMLENEEIDNKQDQLNNVENMKIMDLEIDENILKEFLKDIQRTLNYLMSIVDVLEELNNF